ncbi:MAG: DUF3859 domain-containing protein [Hyphomicrobiales bacterium]|nr:DUF3859 domain-containing protein [Hyphomicrobiales bacterium]
MGLVAARANIGRTWTATAFLAAAVAPASAQAARVDRVQVVEYGIYTATVTSKVASPGTSSGTISLLGDIRHATTTTRIPVQMGEHFGYRYRVFGAPVGALADLTFVTVFPAPGLKKPGAAPKRSDTYVAAKRIGAVSYTGYTLDHPWELLPGTWTFQIWDGGRKLAERKFTLVAH